MTYFDQAANDLKKIKTSSHFFQGRAPKFNQALQPRSRNELPAQTAQTTATPDIKNTTVTPNVTKGRQTRLDADTYLVGVLTFNSWFRSSATGSICVFAAHTKKMNFSL